MKLTNIITNLVVAVAILTITLCAISLVAQIFINPSIFDALK